VNWLGLTIFFFQQYERGKKATDDCIARLNEMEGEPIHLDFCESVMQTVVNEPGGAECVTTQFVCCSVLTAFRSEKAGLCLNIYDVRLKDDIPACGMNWPTDLKNITSYLRVRLSLLHQVHNHSLAQTAA